MFFISELEELSKNVIGFYFFNGIVFEILKLRNVEL